MPKFRKPFFRASRGVWYVQLNGKQINLGSDKDAAFTQWHELTSKPANEIPPPAPPERLVVVIIDEFCDCMQKSRAPATYRWYKDRLNSFCKSIDPELTVDELRPFHVQKWVDAQTHLANGSKRNLITAAKRCMLWAEEQGYISRSPIAHMRRPACGRKEQLVSLAELKKILRLSKDKVFRDVVRFTYITGARPQETLRIEARHIDFANARCILPAHEAKGGRLPRVIYLAPKALVIVRRLAAKYPAGLLFRNTDGLPWTPDATNCRFQRIKKKIGVKYSLYSLRHSFATRALQRGVDCMTVATLLSHRDVSMLARHYQHLSQSPAFLLDQARRVSA